MQYITFDTINNFKIAFLSYDLDYPGMLKSYVENGFIKNGAPEKISEECIAYALPFTVTGAKKKKKRALSVAERREFLSELLAVLSDLGVEHVLVAVPDYYKTLTGAAKAAAEVGVLHSPDSAHFGDFAHMKVGYIPNHKMMFFDPEKTHHGINLAVNSVLADRANKYAPPGEGILKKYYFPTSHDEIEEALDYIVEIPHLAIDIEGFSLEHHDAGIGSIAFSWNENEGIAFQVDWAPGFPNIDLRWALITFFKRRHILASKETYRNLFHNAGYDVPVLIYQLSLNHMVARNLEQLFDWFTSNGIIEDTKIISYLATNSTAGNKLSLKDQAIEFAGNYAVDDIKDITKIPVRELLEYNLIDACATNYVYNKNRERMMRDRQGDVYYGIFLPSLLDVIEMQLNGLPVDMNQVAKSKKALEEIRDQALGIIRTTTLVVDYTQHLKEQEAIKRNETYKKKRVTAADIDLTFNPNSDTQLAGLLYGDDFFGLPVLGTTDSGAPSTKGTYIKALKNHTTSDMVKQFLDAIIDLKDASILLSTFIPALENARWNEKYQWHFMHGNFNLGGTVSGRLSSSDPNLQNLPSKSRLAKWIKYCVRAPKGWLFVGLDFDSLEDKISGLLTKDPNKLKVYTDGYDGHSLRALSYFGDKMPDIVSTSVESVNTIGEKYPELRQLSKTPTFLLTYGGTYHGLMEQCGFDQETAERIESNYHELYKVSDQFVAAELEKARQRGYVEVAFGLRVRTPILAQTVDTERHTPFAAKAEGRTAGNALGQSWGLLNNRACSEVMNRLRTKDRHYRQKIRVCCQIHDAQYYMIKGDQEVLLYLNHYLSRAVQWQEHPAIAHNEVKLSGELSVFYPSWAEEYTISNNATFGELDDLGEKIMKDLYDVEKQAT
jgi:DNA polymerase-1